MRLALMTACSLILASATLAKAPIRLMPLRPHVSSGIAPAAPPANAHLEYYGGPVIANVHVVPVFWGGSVSSAVTSGIADFYVAVTDSAHFDLFKEYDTTVLDYAGQQGTNQQIRRGTAQAGITITPANTKTSITDQEIQTELQHQISAGVLPVQTSNNIYMIHFPSSITISLPDGNGGTATSCSQFCAYHSTIAGNTATLYGVIPDVTAGSCALGCGPTGGGFNNTTSVASHELVEATTDAQVGLATANAPPLAWYDPQGQNGEIGDICNGTQGTINSHGKTWTVQQEWSNTHGACLTEPTANDFYISLSPGNLNVAAGSSATFTITSGVLAGAVASATLSATGLPTGVTASFSTTTLAPGSSATVTISASAQAVNGDNVFTLHAVGGGQTRIAKAHATVSGGTTGGGGGGGGGGCPAGSIDIGGVCIPTGCSTSSSGGNPAGGLVILVAGAALLLRRRRA